mmetsp:Transcript_38328/g.76006  ORF Transcript_38328/g.76006 Transcript_38328/m.76006 type:complete len:94 (-) Transcript_38328:3016-3297(-)
MFHFLFLSFQKAIRNGPAGIAIGPPRVPVQGNCGSPRRRPNTDEESTLPRSDATARSSMSDSESDSKGLDGQRIRGTLSGPRSSQLVLLPPVA